MSSDAFLDANGLRIQTVTTSADVATYWLQRTTSHTGGSPSHVASGFRIDHTVGAGVANFEWAFTTVMQNYASGGENVGGYLQGNMHSTGATWGGVAEFNDSTFTDSTGKQGGVGFEIDCYINGADVSGNRVGLQVICGDAQFNRLGTPGLVGTANYGIIINSQTGGASQQFINGLVVNSAVGAGVVVNTTNSVPQAFRVQNHADIGFDTSLATIGIAAIRIAQGHTIAFNAAGTRQLQHDGSGLLLSNPGGATTYWAWKDNGTLFAGTTQLLGARQNVTGSRATDAWRTSLMAALATHGLITDSTTA